MKRWLNFLKSNPFALIGALITIIGFLSAVYIQSTFSLKNITRQAETKSTLLQFRQEFGTLSGRLKEVEDRFPVPDNMLEQSAILAKIKEFESKIEGVEESTLALRQAINPLKPDEVLTIARLTDEVVAMRKDFTELQESIRKDQDSFEKSMLREVNTSSQSTNLILVVLIPLVLNFLYAVWKDLKGGKREQP